MNFIREAVRIIASDLDQATRERLREQLKGKSYQEQLAVVTAEAMKGWREPACLRGR